MIDVVGEILYIEIRKKLLQAVRRVKQLYPEICNALGYSQQAYYKHLKVEAGEALPHVIVIKMVKENYKKVYGQEHRNEYNNTIGDKKAFETYVKTYE